MLFKRSVIPMHIQSITYIHGAIPLALPLPLLVPPCLPFVSPPTYLAPSSCDRNRPPPSQVACKLTPLPTPHPIVPLIPNSQNPNCPAPNNDDLGNIPALAIRNTPLLRSSLGAGGARTALTSIFLTQQISRAAPRPHPRCLSHRLAIA